jgi:nitrous oxide reductase accessory protein NosL
MKTANLSLLIALTVLLCFVQPLFASNEEKEIVRPSCQVCGMYIDEFHDTATELALKNGDKIETCGVACMIRLINDQGGPDGFSSIRVHDWKTKTLVPAANATYVIGSRVIPDMIPNIIAFNDKNDAEEFKSKEGGEFLDFTQALLSISPMGMTMPTRIKTAVISPKGSLSAGVGYMHMAMDKVLLGSRSIDPLNFVRRPGQMMGPKKMTSDADMLMLNYGITDDLSLGISEAYFYKKMETYKMGGAVTQTTHNDGCGDVDANLRYGLWKDVYYSKFFSLLFGTTLPTGEFKKEYINMIGLQNGTGALSFTGGLLYSQRWWDLWFHAMSSYTTGLENGDDYRFGDTTRLGAALHYTPNYDLMTGLEIDGTYFDKDEYQDIRQGNTGGFRSYITGVTQWRFLTAFGGNFSIRALAGIPIYEDLNHYKVGQSEKVKMGGGYFALATINFSKRFPVY